MYFVESLVKYCTCHLGAEFVIQKEKCVLQWP